MATAKSEKSRKNSIHKNFRLIEIVDTKGGSYKLASTFGQDVMKLDIDVNTHPAWTQETGYVNMSEGKVAKFNDRYSGLSFLKK